MSSLISVSVCLDDLEAIQGAVTKSDKNGKRYANIVVSERREPASWGDTHTVYASQTKEERAAKAPKVFVGSGKEFTFNSTPATVEVEDDGMPF